MADISYQNIFNIIKPSLPEKWDSIVINAVFVQDTCEIKYLIWHGNTFTECYNLSIDGNILLQMLYEIQNEIAIARNSCDELNKWSSVKITITSQGTFDAEFEYSTDIF